MKNAFVLCVASTISACTTLPPSYDPEGCDRVGEVEKQAGSAVVIDGELICATADSDCELVPTKIILNRSFKALPSRVPVHILRREADAYDRDLRARNDIAFCFPPNLWYPSAGRYKGRYYLNLDQEGRFYPAFRPRTKG